MLNGYGLYALEVWTLLKSLVTAVTKGTLLKHSCYQVGFIRPLRRMRQRRDTIVSAWNLLKASVVLEYCVTKVLCTLRKKQRHPSATVFDITINCRFAADWWTLNITFGNNDDYFVFSCALYNVMRNVFNLVYLLYDFWLSIGIWNNQLRIVVEPKVLRTQILDLEVPRGLK